MKLCAPFIVATTLGLTLCAGLASAQLGWTLPPFKDTSPGGVGVAGVIGDRNTASVMQALYDAELLTGIPKGAVIAAIQFRLSNVSGPASWPAAGLTIADYRVTLAQTNKTAATHSATFADNLVSPVLVRSGALALNANAYPAAFPSAVAAWGPSITFQTPYVYQGGSLILEVRNSGSTGNFFGCDGIAGATSLMSGWSSSGNINSVAGTTRMAPVVRVLYYPAADAPNLLGSGLTKLYIAPQFAEVSGSATFSAPLLSNPRTLVSVMDQSMFQSLGSGSLVRGMAFASAYTYDWPAADFSFSKYDVQLSRSLNGPGSLSTTVAGNTGVDAVTVRSGVLNVPQGAMMRRAFGQLGVYNWEIPFKNFYPYKGGHLFTVIRHDGGAVNPGLVEGVAQSDGIYNRLVQSKSSLNSSTDTQTTSVSAFPLTRYSVDALTIVPLAAANGPTASTNNGNAGPVSGSENKYQVIVAASELKHIAPGSLITSIGFQNLQSFASGWPNASGSFGSDYTIELSDARRHPSTMSTTFVDNEGGDKLVVRSGPIAFVPGALPSGTSGAFGATIQFDRGYTYRGGDLCVTFKKGPLTNATTKFQGAGPASAVRGLMGATRNSATGSLDTSFAGLAMQFGYVASDQTPSTVRFERQFSGGGRFLFGGSRVHQNVFNPEVVGVPIGALITGATWKLFSDTEAPFPSEDAAFDRFDISLSSAPVRAENMTETFADNEGTDLVVVRSGPLTLPKGSYVARTGSVTNDFGMFIQFSRPFVYKGGPLALTFRESQGGPSDLFVNFEASNVSARGLRSTAGPDELTGSSLPDGVVTRFAFTRAAPCPGDLNNDGLVDDSDFVLFLAAYNTLDCADGSMPFGCPADFNRDLVVDDVDFTVFLTGYNSLVCP